MSKNFLSDRFLNNLKKAYFLFSRQLDGSLISVSTAVTSVLGYSRNEFVELMGQSLAQNSLQSDHGTAEYEIRISHRDGSPRWFKIVEIPVFSEAGEIKAFDCMAHDITRHKNATYDLMFEEKALRETLGRTIESLVTTVESREHFSVGHHKRSSAIARTIAQDLGMSAERTDTIRLAAVIHDVGKITIPLEILNKSNELNDVEYGIIQGHPEAGYRILQGLDLPWPLADIVYQHHERLDGSGYPNQLSGDQILPESRILAVADVLEAMGSDRSHRSALELDSIIEEVTEQKGTLYDSDVVDASVRLLKEKKILLN